MTDPTQTTPKPPESFQGRIPLTGTTAEHIAKLQARMEEDRRRKEQEAAKLQAEAKAIADAKEARRKARKFPATAAMSHISKSHPDLLDMDTDELSVQAQIAKVAKAREDSEVSRIKRELAQGSIVRTKEVRTRMQEMAAAIISVLTPGIWTDLRASTDGMDVEVRQKLKELHDKAITGLRERIAEALAKAPKFKTRKEKNGHQ